MNNFNFYSPTYFVFGKERENEVGKYITRFGGHKVLIHYGGGSVVKSGLLDRVKNALTIEGIAYVELGGVMPNPRDGLVYQGIEICKKEEVDFILAVGGGSVIDSAKAIAAGSVYEGDFWDFFEGKAIVEKALPVGTVLTIAAAGSEGSLNSVITKEEGMYKRGAAADALRPKFSVLNPELTNTLPVYQTACGATDIMAHVLERYFTNTKDVDITDALCEAVLSTIVKSVPKVIKDPMNYELRANIMWAGMIAHNDMCGVGRVQDWGSHHIEHELSAEYDCAHGAGLAVIFPAWMSYVYKQDVMRFAKLAVKVWGCDMDYFNPEYTALEGIKKFKDFLIEIGMPVKFSELGGKEEDIDKMAEKAVFGAGRKGTIGSFVKLDKEDVINIYRISI